LIVCIYFILQKYSISTRFFVRQGQQPTGKRAFTQSPAQSCRDVAAGGRLFRRRCRGRCLYLIQT